MSKLSHRKEKEEEKKKGEMPGASAHSAHD
jgi:hypothetical protein